MPDITALYLQVFSFGILVLVAHFMGKLTYRLHFGELLGQVLGGVLVNPYLLQFLHIGGEAYALTFQNFYFFTIIFFSVVSFSLGEELRFQKLREVGKQAAIICLVQISLTFTLVAGGFLLLGYDKYLALILGSISLATSHAVTYVIANKLSLEGELQKVLANIIVLDDVIEVLVFSVIVTYAAGVQENRAISLFNALVDTLGKVSLAIVLGSLSFLLLKTIIRNVEIPDKSIPTPPDTGFQLLWNVFHEHPSQSIQVMFVVVGLLSLSVSLAMKLHLPFILVPIVMGIAVSNFHRRELFDALKIEEMSSFFNLMFFALIGANIPLGHIRRETLGAVGVYIVGRSVGKLLGTWLGAWFTKPDLKIRRCLPRLMLPQAAVAAVEATYAALILKDGEIVMNVILPSLIFFEIVGLILSEKTLNQWKAWTIGEEEVLQRPSIAKRPVLLPSGIRMSEYLSPALIKIPLRATDKVGVILELLELLQRAKKITNLQIVLQDIMARERLMSTGIGDGVAIPHGRTAGLTEVVCAFGLKPEGINFKSIDGQPADIFFLILSPENKPRVHLKFLAAISSILRDEEHRQAIRALTSASEAAAFFTTLDAASAAAQNEPSSPAA